MNSLEVLRFRGSQRCRRDPWARATHRPWIAEHQLIIKDTHLQKAISNASPAILGEPKIIKDTHLQKAISNASPAILGEPAPNVTSKHAGAKGMIAQTRGFGLR